MRKDDLQIFGGSLRDPSNYSDNISGLREMRFLIILSNERFIRITAYTNRYLAFSRLYLLAGRARIYVVHADIGASARLVGVHKICISPLQKISSVDG